MRERARPTPSGPSPTAGERIDKAAEEKTGRAETLKDKMEGQKLGVGKMEGEHSGKIRNRNMNW